MNCMHLSGSVSIFFIDIMIALKAIREEDAHSSENGGEKYWGLLDQEQMKPTWAQLRERLNRPGNYSRSFSDSPPTPP